MTEKEIQLQLALGLKASEMLHKLVTNDQAKLRWGSMQRQKIKTVIDAGHQPSPGYRVDWLQNTAMEIIGLLRQKAHEFNTLFPHDRISTEDFLDVLNTAVLKIRNFVNKG
jgi:hypothetical protein